MGLQKKPLRRPGAPTPTPNGCQLGRPKLNILAPNLGPILARSWRRLDAQERFFEVQLGGGPLSSIKSHLGASWSDMGAATDSGPPRRRRSVAKNPALGDGYRSSKKLHLKASWGVLGAATDSEPPRRRRGAAKIPPRGDGYRSSKKLHLKASWGVLGVAADSQPPQRRCDASRTPPRVLLGPPNIKRTLIQYIQYVL